MHRLASYPHITYDANCLLYYCVYSEFKDGSQIVKITFPSLTDKVRIITESLVNSGKKIKSIEPIYDELAKTERAGRVVEELITLPEIRLSLKLKSGQKFPALIKHRLIKSLDKKIRGLKGKIWFHIVPFVASDEDLKKVRNFYNSFGSDERMLRIMSRKNRKVCYPSDEDMHLICFSAKDTIPILTNDSDLTDFKDELLSNSLSCEIVPLAEVTFTTTL